MFIRRHDPRSISKARIGRTAKQALLAATANRVGTASPVNHAMPRIVFSAFLIATGVARSTDLAVPDSLPARTYRECLRHFEPYAEGLWHPVPGRTGEGYFGDGASSGNGGIRGTCGVALSYAVLFRADAVQSAETAARRLTRVEQALRYAARTHRSGTESCVDGRQWGLNWQSGLWTGSLGLACVLLESRLPENLVAACRRVVAVEADRLAKIPPPSGFRGDSKAEENAWNSNVVSLAASWLHDDSRAAVWNAAAKRYLVNTYTVPKPVNDPLKAWVSTVTLHPSFACENHGFFHPSYQMVAGMSLGDSLLMAHLANAPTASELQPFAEHNVMAAWKCLAQVLLDSGELAYPSGLDWALHGYGQVSYLSWLSTHYDDPLARWAEQALAKLMAYRQTVNADGRFTGASVRNGFYREAVMARRTAIAYLHHAVAIHPDGPSTPPASFAAHLTDVRLFLHRSHFGFTSLSYGPVVMAMVVPATPADGKMPFVVTPRVPGLVDIGPAAGKGVKATVEQARVTEHGFDARLALVGPLFRSRIRVVSFGDSTVLVEVPESVFRLRPNRKSRFPVGIENDPLTGGERLIRSGQGTVRVPAMTGKAYELTGRWACVSARLGYVPGPEGRLRYRTASGYNRRGAAGDTLDFVPADPASPRYVIVLPSADGPATGRVWESIVWEVGATAATLAFTAPSSGSHRVSVALPENSRKAQVPVPISKIVGSSEGPKYPAALAADGDAETFWVSHRGSARPGGGPTPAHPEWLHVRFAAPARIGSIVVVPRPRYGPREIELSLDGHSVYAGKMRDEPLEVVLPQPIVARDGRLVITGSHDPRYPDKPRNTQVAEIFFLPTGER